MNDELSSPPGWYEETSMFNSSLLGAVMERATGKMFPQLLKEYITDTLHLKNTFIDYPEITIEGRSEFYDKDMMGKIVNAPFMEMRHSVPSIGILSNAEDLVKLGMAILNSDYFGKEFAQKLFEPCELYGNYKSKMANGWIVTVDNQGRDVNARSGNIPGGGAVLVLYPEENLVIAYAQNLTHGDVSLPVLDIANYFLEGLQK
jgi:CubicO group peptidase (beta-lactamase class C family)